MTKQFKCPKCKASIEKGVTLCGNCKARLAWDGDEPRLSTAYAIGQLGWSMTKLGCLIPIIVLFAIILYVFLSLLGG